VPLVRSLQMQINEPALATIQRDPRTGDWPRLGATAQSRVPGVAAASSRGTAQSAA